MQNTTGATSYKNWKFETSKSELKCFLDDLVRQRVKKKTYGLIKEPVSMIINNIKINSI